MITAPDYSTHGNNDCNQLCGDAVNPSQDAEYIAKCPNADTIITLFRNSKFRSCAPGRREWNSLSCQDESDKGRLILHETGHAFGLLADEYVEASLGDNPWGPNCAGTKEEATQKWGDLVGQGGVGYFNGCSYTADNVRPTENSIMKSHYYADSYGLVNERAIRKIIGEYK